MNKNNPGDAQATGRQVEAMVKQVYDGKEYVVQVYIDWETGQKHSWWVNGYGSTVVRTRDLTQSSSKKKFIIFAAVGSKVNTLPNYNSDYVNNLNDVAKYIKAGLTNSYRNGFLAYLNSVPSNYLLSKGIRDVVMWSPTDDEVIYSS